MIAIEKFVETALDGLDELKKILPQLVAATDFQGADTDQLEKEFKD